LNFRFADLEINVARRELRRAGTIVHTEPQVFDLLVHLVRNRQRIVGKDELFDAIWHGRIVSEATLNSRISAARRALGDSGSDQNLIRTLHKRGFRFVGEIVDDDPVPAAVAAEQQTSLQGAVDEAANVVPAGESLSISEGPSIAFLPLAAAGHESDREQAADDFTAAAATTAPPSASASDAAGEYAPLHGIRAGGWPLVEHGAPPKPRRIARTPLLAVAAIGLVSLTVLAVLWLQSPSTPPVPDTSVALASAAADRLRTQVPSIVVLPFNTRSDDTKQDYLADGITDSLISDLVRAMPGISVVSRGTAFTYKGRAVDARQIGRELGVRYLLKGSIAFEGERVRVNTELADTNDGNQLWAERFDTERKGILQVQDEIVARVSRAIGLKVVDIEARRSWRERPSSAELIDLIMRGKAVLNLPSSPATMTEARGLFEQALAVEPASVDGLTGVATTLVFEFLNGYYETGPGERLPKAELLLDQAAAIEPAHLMTLKARAALRRAQGKFDDAIAVAQTVIMENPGEPWAYKEIGLSNVYLGRPEEALDWFGKAARIGPRDPARWTWLDGRGHALILLGRDEEAIHALTSALDANPKNLSSHAFLAAAYALLDRPDEARAALAAYLQRRPDTRVSTFRRLSPVPFTLTSAAYRQQHERISEGLRKAGMPE
jgi:TolB-like protein/DNA-binding winged helix-turn-helix (wHTH) protein/cytochrome c-type biogenesis protein CcmH/NrfG